MSPVAKLGLFAAVLLVVFGGGLAIGAVAGPFDEPPPPTHAEHNE